MEFSLIVFKQVAIMSLLMVIGFVICKLKLVDKKGSIQMTNLLLCVVAPAVIINAFQTPFNEQRAKNLLIAFLLGFASHAIAIGLSYVLIRKKNNPTASIDRFAMAYSNCGFMALPLVEALYGSEGVFYASAYMVVFQILSWTHGYMMMSGKSDRKTILKSLFSPVIVSVAVGLVLFLTKFTLPEILLKTVSYTASLNTPLAMVVIGISLAQANLLDAFKSVHRYYIVFLINFVAPIAPLIVYSFFPALPKDIVLINIISTACPCAALTLMFAQKFDKGEDGRTQSAGHLLTLSNLVSIVSIPLVVFLSTLLLNK